MRQKHRIRPKTAFSSVIKSANFTIGGVPQDVGEQKRLLRGLLNVRPARGATEDF